MKLAPIIDERLTKPVAMLAAVASIAGPLAAKASTTEAAGLPTATGQRGTLLHGDTFGEGTGLLIDYSVGNGVYCGPEARYSDEEKDRVVGSNMSDNDNMVYYSGHTAFLGLLSGQTSDAYYSIKTGWALHKNEDLSYSLLHFDTENYKKVKYGSAVGKPYTITEADMVGQKVASFSLSDLAVFGSETWTDGETDFDISPYNDQKDLMQGLFFLKSDITQFDFTLHVQCAQPGPAALSVPDAQEITPNKSLGQHWLHDKPTLEAIADAVSTNSSDVILEIGPGLGTLTELLVAKAKQVIAVEFDERLASILPARVQATNLKVVTSDILSFDFSQVPTGYKIVANIPYYLTSNLIRVISETPNPPMAAAMLIQKEVAERVAATPGDMSLLSVTAQYYWEVGLGELVPAELFTPPPKVDSQVLILKRRPTPLFDDVTARDFFRLVKAGFSQRRKTLLNSLSAGLQLDKAAVRVLCESVGVDPSRRAQTLSLEEWHNLYLSWQT